MPLRVLVADDHMVVRQGLVALLQREGFEVIGEAGDGQEAMRLVEKLQPDAVVLDVAMPLLNGIDAAREISKKNPKTKAILLTMLTEDHYVLESLHAGIRGYVLKSNSAEELVQAIREVCKGKVYLSPGAASAVVQAYVAKADAAVPQLTERERQVLQLVSESKSTKEIAVLLVRME